VSSFLWERIPHDEKLLSILRIVHDQGPVDGFRELSRMTSIHPFQIRGYIVGRKDHYAPLKYLVLHTPVARGRKTLIRLSSYGSVFYHLITNPSVPIRELLPMFRECLKTFTKDYRYYKSCSRNLQKFLPTPRPLLPYYDEDTFVSDILKEVYRDTLLCPRCREIIKKEKPVIINIHTKQKLSLSELYHALHRS